MQRAELLDAILADLYGAAAAARPRLIPPAACSTTTSTCGPWSAPRRGQPAAVHDRRRPRPRRERPVEGDLRPDPGTSGAGYAMQNRRVVSRVLPEIYHQAHLHRLTPFFQAMRLALVDAAPRTVEDPRVVVLSPGTHSETAFDQAFVASLLGFPLLEGSDLTVRDGRVWMRVLGKLEQVDVILRRVDSTWMDALELRPGIPAGRDRAAGVRTPGHGQRGQQPRLRSPGEPRSAALPARPVRAAARRAPAAALGGHLVVRRPGGARPRARHLDCS